MLGGLVIALVQFPDRAVPGTVDPSILRNLLLIYLPVYALFNAAAIGVLIFYRIDKATHEENQAKLRAQGVAAADQMTESGVQPPSNPLSGG
jgi:hypothetical protein